MDDLCQTICYTKVYILSIESISMNIFILDHDMEVNVQYYMDAHIRKMIIESAQMLSMAIWWYYYQEEYPLEYFQSESNRNQFKTITGLYTPSRKHLYHPCTKWARESYENFQYLKQLGLHINAEWQYRYDHNKYTNHGSAIVIKNMIDPIRLPNKGLTPFYTAVTEQCKDDDPILAYRKYYIYEKQHLAKWKNRRVPSWFRYQG